MNPYVIVGAVIALLLVIGGAYMKGESVGYQSCQADTQEAVDQEAKRQREQADELKLLEDKRNVKITKRTINIKQKIKPGECLDTDAPPDVLDDLGWMHDQRSTK